MKLNKKAGIKDYGLEIAISLIVIGVILVIVPGIIFGIIGVIPDAVCNYNVQFATLVTIDGVGAKIPFCHQYEEMIEITVDNKVDCNSFINFEGGENYKDLCEKNKETAEWKKKYVSRQIMHLLERCIYMSGRNDEVNVDCFEFNFTGINEGITMADITEARTISKSYYKGESKLSNRDLSHRIWFNFDASIIPADSKIVIDWKEDEFFGGDPGRIVISTKEFLCDALCDAYDLEDNQQAGVDYKDRGCRKIHYCEELADINYIDDKCGNGRCEDKENPSNCPQDCPAGTISTPFNVDASGAMGWDTCETIDDGIDAAKKFCICNGYDDVAPGDSCNKETKVPSRYEYRYTWSIDDDCNIIKGTKLAGGGSAVTKIKCIINEPEPDAGTCEVYPTKSEDRIICGEYRGNAALCNVIGCIWYNDGSWTCKGVSKCSDIKTKTGCNIAEANKDCVWKE
ncbi:hypothetical protein HN510_04385 [Candidatus Woesearchaeota archaeon]|nr:hypothetical protein [Candidatus Woesearchaeota archaeon]